MIIPKKLDLANIPTVIKPLNLDLNNKAKLYIKRDDFTGMELSGNKVRKLEYSVKEALDEGAKVLITCGGIQSNHARATASVAASLGLKSHLILSGRDDKIDGNLFLDKLFDAKIDYVSRDEYNLRKDELLKEVHEDYKAKGVKSYIIPEGASNGIGLFGYYNAFYEILEQEKDLGLTFDTICVAEGSGGTYSGLYLANEISKSNKNIISLNIYNNTDKQEKMKNDMILLIEEGIKKGQCKEKVSYDNINIINKYVGEGYGKASADIFEFIKDAARKTGIVFDPVYTGKALFGIVNELKNENPDFKGNILFIHTGGLFGAFARREDFDFY